MADQGSATPDYPPPPPHPPATSDKLKKSISPQIRSRLSGLSPVEFQMAHPLPVLKNSLWTTSTADKNMLICLCFKQHKYLFVYQGLAKEEFSINLQTKIAQSFLLRGRLRVHDRGRGRLVAETSLSKHLAPPQN